MWKYHFNCGWDWMRLYLCAGSPLHPLQASSHLSAPWVNIVDCFCPFFPSFDATFVSLDLTVFFSYLSAVCISSNWSFLALLRLPVAAASILKYTMVLLLGPLHTSPPGVGSRGGDIIFHFLSHSLCTISKSSTKAFISTFFFLACPLSFSWLLLSLGAICWWQLLLIYLQSPSLFSLPLVFADIVQLAVLVFFFALLCCMLWILLQTVVSLFAVLVAFHGLSLCRFSVPLPFFFALSLFFTTGWVVTFS